MTGKKNPERDERISLHPAKPEDVIRALLKTPPKLDPKRKGKK